jgi:quercetin dioxygenase-like cupin family protein
MSKPVYDPNRRLRYAFSRDGENLVVDIWAQPGADVPTHFHPSQEERWAILEGRVRFKVGGRKLVAGAGDELVAAPGVKHSFKNIGDREARLRANVRPALELQAFLEDAAALARAGFYTRRGFPTSPRGAVRMAEFIERYRDLVVICWPPQVVQRLLLAPLTRFSGRARAT